MNKIYKSAALSFLFLTGYILIANAQQQFTFTQYMNNLTPVNAAYSLLDDAAKVNVTGRKQFIGIDGSPTSFLFTGSVPLAGVAGSAGLTVLNDKVGPDNLTEINAFFAKRIQLSTGTFLSAAINAGLRNHKLNYSQLDATDPQFNNGDFNQTFANVGLGVMLYSSKYYIGVSLPRFSLQKDNSFTNTYYAAGAYLFSLGKDFNLKPAALLSYAGNSIPTTLDVSATFYLKNILGVGANYRNNQTVSGILSLLVNKNIQVGYSYGFNAANNALGGINNSTQEVTISYRFGKTVSDFKLL